MHEWDTVAIVGVGLIGGSIGRALRANRLARRVIGASRRRETLAAALEIGAVDATAQTIGECVAEAELIVVCTPVQRIVEHVREAAAACPPEAILTDAGSTKAELVRQLSGLSRPFVGSHPLAGSERTGVAHSDPELFRKRLVVVTPTPAARPEHVARVHQFWRALGADTREMDADSHDRVLAFASHLPHLAASALAATTPRDALPFTATGWSDATRIAAGDPELWRQILIENRSHVLQSLGKLVEVLASFEQALQSRDSAQLKGLLESGKRNRDAVGN